MFLHVELSFLLLEKIQKSLVLPATIPFYSSSPLHAIAEMNEKNTVDCFVILDFLKIFYRRSYCEICDKVSQSEISVVVIVYSITYL